MILDKTLLLKGVAGVAAVGGVVWGGYVIKNKFLTKAPTKEEKLTEINKKLTILGLDGCHFTEKEIVNVNDYSRECELDLTKLQKIKFSNKGDSNVTVAGLTGDEKIKLKIAENNSKVIYTFKDIKTKLTISGDSTKPNITLKAEEEREFEDKGGKLGKVSKASSSEAEKTKKVNAKLETLNIPAKCRFEEEDKDTSLECDLSDQNDLKKIDFANKQKGKDSTIEGATNGLKLTINRLSDKDGELKHSPKADLEFIFGGTYTNEIKIKDNRASGGYGDIILKPKTNPILTISTDNSDSKDRLTKLLNYHTLGFKLGLSCSGTSPNFSCSPSSVVATIKLLNSDGKNIEEIKVANGQDSDQIITAEENVSDYELGVKFKVTKAFPTTDPKLELNSCYEAKYLTGKGWGLSKRSSC